MPALVLRQSNQAAVYTHSLMIASIHKFFQQKHFIDRHIQSIIILNVSLGVAIHDIYIYKT